MKKLLSIILSIVIILSVLSLVGCGSPLKLGVGIVSYTDNIKSADADTNGSATNDTTVAAVLVDKDGKIVKCDIDALSATLEFTSKGKFVETKELKTKYELGKDYNMVAYGKAKKEWFEQADAFEALVAGKTLKEVQALVAEGGKGNKDVVNAGCTIVISDFITAIEKAVTTASESGASAKDNLKVGIVATQTGCKNASEEATGINEIDLTVCAATTKSGKVTAMLTDALAAAINFNTKGAVSDNIKINVSTKLEIGDGYGMAQHGKDLNGDGTVKEWYDQAKAFNAAAIDKDADGITALALETGYGVGELQTAGCTINITDIVKAATKAAK
ncbi:MAG: hypothetical protein E7537_03795 [Ruminococcaceae bacterium]|nr:hypothetical protein [Oscillospiraceae bacterium]